MRNTFKILYITSISAVILFFIVNNISNGDTIYLKGVRKPVLLKVDKVTGKYIIAIIERNIVKNISIKPDNTTMYPDDMYFSINQEYATRCKIIDMANNVYVVKIPMSDIESLDIDQKGSGSDRYKDKYSQNYNEQPYYNDKQESDEQPYYYSDKQESREAEDKILGLELVEDMEFEELRTDDRPEEPFLPSGAPLYEREREIDITEQNNQNQQLSTEELKEQIKKELMATLQEEKKEEETKILLENTGKITGKILRHGKPYPNCEIMIVAIEEQRVLFQKKIKRGEQLVTVTDEYGKYYYDHVNPGTYKLFWKPHYEKSWIRRLDMKPDIFVTPGRTAFPKTVEISKRIVN